MILTIPHRHTEVWKLQSAPEGDSHPSGTGHEPRVREPCSICPARSRPAALKPRDPSRAPPRLSARQDSQQLLKCPLLVDLVGAVADVGVEVLRGVLFHDVTDVGNDEVFLVSLLQVFKEAKERISSTFTTGRSEQPDV